MNLEIKVLENLVLRDPFWIASSHWTSEESVFKKLALVEPSAVTLKTTSQKKGGGGVDPAGRKRVKRNLEDSFGNSFGVYTDGPKKVELWDISTTFRKTQLARTLLPNSIIGLSVLQGEDYAHVADRLDLKQYGFVELNLKYSFRTVPIEQLPACFEDLKNDILEFFSVFGPLPILVKLPREIAQFFASVDFQDILTAINNMNGGIIVANSRRLRVPPSRSGQSPPTELPNGVIVGEYLFLETYDLIRSLNSLDDKGSVPPIVASGGIVDIRGFLDIIAAGAKCTQLCTILDIHDPQIIMWFRNQLDALASESGSFHALAEHMQADATFWGKTVKKSSTFVTDISRLVDEVFQDSLDQIRLAIAEAFTLELGGVSESQPRETIDKKVVADSKLRVAVIRGNMSTFLLSLKCAREFGFQPRYFDGASDILKTLSFDFAIIPEYLLDEISGAIKIGTVANSVYELRGQALTDIQDISTVYNFNGNSARRALSDFLESHKPLTTEIIRPKLLPLLRFWNEGSAILAKPPLSQIYGLFLPPEMSDHWNSVWQTQEPLILIASQDLAERDADFRIAKTIMAFIEDERARIIQDSSEATREIIDSGFVNYCRKLLGATEHIYEGL